MPQRLPIGAVGLQAEVRRVARKGEDGRGGEPRRKGLGRGVALAEARVDPRRMQAIRNCAYTLYAGASGKPYLPMERSQ